MRIILMFIVFLSFATNVFAGKITGKVTDEKTGEAIIGAVIAVKNTDKGSVSDVDGNYFIEIAEGNYVLEIKYAGYTTKEIENVEVKGSEPILANITIKESTNSQTLEEVVVRSSLKKENISALYTIQKNAASVSDGISADVIRRSPDRSTGEVLKRVSGTTIQDNKFVVVRGLTDRYNTALIDNAILPSTEPNRKAFSFDIIPSAMIDNIVITKAATPDLPGDFAGGVINILTKEAPDANYNSISLGTSYNTVSTGNKFLSGYRSSTDFLGFDDGSRKLPSGFPSQSAIQNLTKEQNIAALNSLNNNFTIKEHTAMPGINFQVAAGRSYALKNSNKIGLTAAVTYNHTENIKKNLAREYDNLDVVDNVYNYSSNLGALLNAGYYFGSSKIVFKTLYNRIFDDNFLYREGYNFSSQNNIRYYAFDLIQKSLFKTSLEGEHQVGKAQSKIGWLLSYNNVLNDQPDQRKISYSTSLTSDQNIYFADNTLLGKANSRLFSHLNENIYNGTLYYVMPFKMFENKNSIKVGAFGQQRSRDFYNRYIGAIYNFKPGSDPNADRSRSIQTLYAPDLINEGVYDLEDNTGEEDAYTATATTLAGYVMFDNKFTDKIRLVWGARLESYSLDLSSKEGSTKINPVWNDLLPSANFTYSLNEKSNIRASYFRSVARPELREAAPMGYYDYELNANITGDPKLKRSLIDNYDVRYEYYPKPGEIISASVFYKHFNNTLENKIYAENSAYEISPANYKSATNIGIEAEVRKNLGFIAEGSFLDNMSFYINAAYIKSVVKKDSASAVANIMVSERPLAGQSPYMINSSLSYAAIGGKLNVNLLYNIIGQRLYLVGQGGKGNVYESPRNLLDFQASYNVSKRSEIRLNVKDILNNPYRLYFDQDGTGKFEKQNITPAHIDLDKDGLYQEYRPGTTLSLTYTYKF